MVDPKHAQEETISPGNFPFLKRVFHKITWPGLFLLVVTLIPHIIQIPINFYRRMYRHIPLEDYIDVAIVITRVVQVFVVLAVLSFFLALRIVLRERKENEGKWNFNRVCAALAVLAFIGSIFQPRAWEVYYLSVSLGERLPPKAFLSRPKLYRAGELLGSSLGRHDTDRFYPPLLRMDDLAPPSLPTGRSASLYGKSLPLKIGWKGRFYYYLGYQVRDDAGVQAYAKAYRKALHQENPDDRLALTATGLRRLGDYPLPSSVPGLPLPPEAWSGSPLLIEAINPETATEGHVRFCGGHSEKLPYPGPWPMTEPTMRLLKSLADESL
jgi:hypothetical protein